MASRTQPSTNSRRLQVPSPLPPSVNSNSVYDFPSASVSTSELNRPSSPFSPRALYANSFDRPHSSRSLPSTGPFKKNIKTMTGFATTEEEFDALPLAVRRKYFSTLERLRFAQNSSSNAINELPIQRHRKSSIADRRGLNVPEIESRRISSSPRRTRKLSRQSITTSDASWYLTLPDKIKKRDFTREEQVMLAGCMRESVILDAADEAIYKNSRRASRNLSPLLDTRKPPLSRPRPSTEGGRKSEDSSTSMAAVMYESFRWMDEEEDLDLKLVLDDYHANLDGVVIPTPNSNRRPSFRRQMSVSKMPFGRNSLSSIQPRSPKFDPNANHNRSKSRTMSLISPRHMPHDSVSSIDPNATHYQDPEARLKLRVYLASPQKFDEAIEFGFPSIDGVADGDKENNVPKRISRDFMGTKKPYCTEKSFLDDDTASLFQDDTSMVDPESPLTPLAPETGFRQHRASHIKSAKGRKVSTDSARGATKPMPLKLQESYSQAMAGNREMTLRMTLTRPDLRADENTIYGWQATKSPLREEHPSLSDFSEDKYDMRGPYGGVDGWGPAEKENGVVKRLWNRVKPQRKSSGL